MSEKCHC